MQALSNVELDFDIETIGFDMGEIDLRIESLNPKETSAAEPPIPDVSGPAVSHVGDLWLLGRHRLLCGEAREEAAHAKLMGAERAAAVFSDPPYNVAIDGHVSGLGRVHHREFVMAAGEMTPEAFTAFLTAALERMKESAIPAAPPSSAWTGGICPSCSLPLSKRLWTCSTFASGQSRTPAWAVSTVRSTNWCSCSNLDPAGTATTSSWARMAGIAAMCGLTPQAPALAELEKRDILPPRIRRSSRRR